MSSSALNPATKKRFIRFGWSVVGGLIATLLTIAIIRVVDLFQGSATDALFAARYLENAVVTSSQMLLSLIFVLFAPLQFSTKIRVENPQFHRWLGRTLIFCAIFSAIFGLASLSIMPIFGGLVAASAVWVFVPLFLITSMLALTKALQKRYQEHREWIIRTFAIGLGVGTQRVLLGVFEITGSAGFAEGFGSALWIGFSINLIAAEIWINLTRNTEN